MWQRDSGAAALTVFKALACRSGQVTSTVIGCSELSGHSKHTDSPTPAPLSRNPRPLWVSAAWGLELTTTRTPSLPRPLTFAQFGKYGTRSQTALVVWLDGRVEMRERAREPDGSWRESALDFAISL